MQTLPASAPEMGVPVPDFPDDPRKWEGWSGYRAENPYVRLCLDPRAQPTPEQIQQHCTALLQWWQKKLPLKNQPSNPIAQLLGRGIDEASRFIVQARVQLLDPTRRREIDDQLAAQAREEALAEFTKYVAFSIQSGVLTAEAEANLIEFGQHNGVDDEQIRSCIEEELRRNNAQRVEVAPEAPVEEVRESDDPEKDFLRVLRLSEVNLDTATASVRLVFGAIAHNLGLDPETAKCMLEDYLDEEELALGQTIAAEERRKPTAAYRPKPSANAPVSKPTSAPPAANFINAIGAVMVLIPGGEFVMGSDAPDAAPNEQPLTPVTLSDFHMSRHPITNAQYEQFDRSHRQKRMPGSGDHHPVVNVSSHDAVKFCRWLEQKDGKKYRLPTEAEWEYAARGTDGRKYPWGNHEGRSDLANFADATTSFPWRDPNLSDGYPESSPVGAFPRGASFFGIEDMAGNVWEWCLDFLQPLAGTPKQNPRGAASGIKRIHRGGSWKSRFTNLRATARGGNAPNYSCNDLGFRVVCESGRAS